MTLLIGHMTRKIISEMTYNVSSGTLNSTIPGQTLPVFIARQHTDAWYWYSNAVRLSIRNVPVSDENGLSF